MTAAPHLVLLGDSIFDNRAYTGGGPDVVTQLRGVLPAGWRATLAAIDGDTTAGIRRQIAGLPGDCTHLALSVGGNDALHRLPVLDAPAGDVRAAAQLLASVMEGFEQEYAAAVDECLRPRLPLVLCTIYNGSFADAAFQRVATVMVALFDDVILRTAAARALPVIDLRAVCSRPADYANPIEPSSTGGAKIARAIAAVVTGDGLRTPATRLTVA